MWHSILFAKEKRESDLSIWRIHLALLISIVYSNLILINLGI